MRIQSCVVLLFAALALPVCAASGSAPDLRQDGAFGFRQADAKVLCDTPALRVSLLSDSEYLYIQAIIFEDGDDAPGETADGRAIGDSANVLIDADADGKPTPNVDRSYSLNPWPHLPGLHYSVVLGDRSSTPLRADSKGRGSIAYVEIEGSARVRVDNFLIPLEEIGRKPGDTVRLAYWGSSPVPELTVNSIGFEREGRYFPHHMPRETWHEVTLAAGKAIDIQAVPEGRGTIERPARRPQPEVGAVPPDINAEAWLNWSGPEAPTLASLKGKVVVVEFWATWCGPCVAGIPHLNEMHEKYARDGMVLVSLTDQARPHIEEFMAGREMVYVVGAGSTTGNDYGVRGIPQAFVIARDGTVAWAGHPQNPEFEKRIARELAK